MNIRKKVSLARTGIFGIGWILAGVANELTVGAILASLAAFGGLTALSSEILTIIRLLRPQISGAYARYASFGLAVLVAVLANAAIPYVPLLPP